MNGEPLLSPKQAPSFQAPAAPEADDAAAPGMAAAGASAKRGQLEPVLSGTPGGWVGSELGFGSPASENSGVYVYTILI